MRLKPTTIAVLSAALLAGASAPVVIAEEIPEMPEIPGLQLHLDASNSETLTLDEDGRVLEWRSTVNDIVFVPADEFIGGDWAPELVSGEDNVERPVGGRAVVRFDGSSSLTSDSDDARAMTNDIAGTTFFGVGWNTGGAAQNYMRLMNPEGPTRAMFYRTTDDWRVGARRLDSDGFQDVQAQGARLFEEWGIDSAILDYQNANAFLFVNGEQVHTEPFQTPGRTSPTDSQELNVGSDHRNPRTQLWDGDIAEVIYFDRVLNPQEKAEVGNYLAQKYDLEWPELEPEVMLGNIEGPRKELGFETEEDREYLILHTRDEGDTWDRITEDPIIGTGERLGMPLPLEGNAESFRVVERIYEVHQPGGSEDPELPALDGLRLQLDASDTDNLVLDGLNVVEWHNSAEDEMTFVQDDPDWQPIHLDNIVNGRPALIFGGNSYMETDSPAALGLTNDLGALTFFGVGWNRGGGAQMYMRISTGNPDFAPAQTRTMFYRATNDHRWLGKRLDTDDRHRLIGGPRLQEEWGVDTTVLNFAEAQGFLYINGAEADVDLDFLGPGNTEASDAQRFRLGSDISDSPPGQFWDGDIAEILIYDRALSVDELNEVGEYLAEKYGIDYRITQKVDIDFEVIEGMDFVFTTELGNLYQVEVSENLLEWEPFAEGIEGAGLEERVFVPMAGRDRAFIRGKRVD